MPSIANTVETLEFSDEASKNKCRTLAHNIVMSCEKKEIKNIILLLAGHVEADVLFQA